MTAQWSWIPSFWKVPTLKLRTQRTSAICAAARQWSCAPRVPTSPSVTRATTSSIATRQGSVTSESEHWKQCRVCPFRRHIHNRTHLSFFCFFFPFLERVVCLSHRKECVPSAACHPCMLSAPHASTRYAWSAMASSTRTPSAKVTPGRYSHPPRRTGLETGYRKGF